MQESFQAGVDAIYNAIVAQGTTPAGKTPDQLAAAIGTMATAKYNAGAATGHKLACGSTTGRSYTNISCGFTPSYVAFWSSDQMTIHGYGGNRSITSGGNGWDHASPYAGGFTAWISDPGDAARTIYWFAVS